MSESLPASHAAELLRQAFEVEARELGVQARLEVDDARLTPRFEPQFGASEEWLARTFREELRARAISADPAWCVAPSAPEELARLVDSVRAALRRTRARLVDTDSWVSGGRASPFPCADAVVRERGLATYRAPARSAASITIGPEHVTIALPHADCGDVVSAGIWVPTLLDGNLSITADYRLPEWVAGAREACLGLYAVAADGTFRMYAQRVARADEAPYVMSDVDGAPGPTRAGCERASGSLRIVRELGVLHAWHLDGERWSWLGRVREKTPRPLIVGIKVWASGVSGPLRAEVTNFALSAAAAAAQMPVPPERPDPRQPA